MGGNLLGLGNITELLKKWLSEGQDRYYHTPRTTTSQFEGKLPGATSYSPHSTGWIAFGGGSPHPIDPRPAIIKNALVMTQRMITALAQLAGKPKETK
jgi:hypothetical protein